MSLEKRTIAVLVPVYRDQDGLEKSLSCLDQEKNENLDVFVVDDGSVPPIEIHAEHSHTIHLIRLEKNQGIENALNAGLDAIMKGEYLYIARLDAGDITKPGRMGRQRQILDGNTDIGIVGTWVEFIEEGTGNYLYTFRAPENDSEIRNKMKVNTAFVHSSVMFRAEMIKNLGVYSRDYKAAEDYELWARMLTEAKGYNIQNALVQKEVNLHGISASKRKLQVGNRIKINLKYFDCLDIRSYYGLIKNSLLWLMPLRMTTLIKQKVIK